MISVSTDTGSAKDNLIYKSSATTTGLRTLLVKEDAVVKRGLDPPASALKG